MNFLKSSETPVTIMIGICFHRSSVFISRKNLIPDFSGMEISSVIRSGGPACTLCMQGFVPLISKQCGKVGPNIRLVIHDQNPFRVGHKSLLDQTLGAFVPVVGGFRGSFTIMRVPLFSSDSIFISPPWAWAILLEIKRPSPVPLPLFEEKKRVKARSRVS